jgi:hypothetical protein
MFGLLLRMAERVADPLGRSLGGGYPGLFLANRAVWRDPAEEVIGIAPRAGPPTLLRALRARRKGEIDFTELAPRVAMGETRDRSILYAGYALKPQS